MIADDSLTRALAVSADAARYGFDWPNASEALLKVTEEVNELEEAIALERIDRQAEELGDLLFAVVNVARLLSLDAGDVLSVATDKFEKRFAYVLDMIEKQQDSPSLALMESWWELAKKDV